MLNICVFLISFFTYVCSAQIWVDLKTHEMMYINQDLNEYLYSKGDGKFIKMNLLNKLKTDDIMFCHLNLNLYFGNDKSKIYNIKVIGACGVGMTCQNPDGSSQSFIPIGKGKKLSYNELLQNVFLTDFEDFNTKENMKFYLSKDGKLAVDYSPNGVKWMNCTIVSGSLQELQLGIYL